MMQQTLGERALQLLRGMSNQHAEAPADDLLTAAAMALHASEDHLVAAMGSKWLSLKLYHEAFRKRIGFTGKAGEIKGSEP